MMGKSLSCVILALILSFLAAGQIMAAPSPQAYAEWGDRAEEVQFSPAEGVILSGTLLKPSVDSAQSFPVAVFISGTGPSVRGSRFNQTMAKRLTADGIAVLDYDVRGQGRSSGAFTGTINEMQRDVESAVAYLRARPDIDPRRIALVGQSQGGIAGPGVASLDGQIAAVVILSGPVGPRGELFTGIMRSNLSQSGRSSEVVEAVVAATADWMEARSRDLPDPEITRLRKTVVAGFVLVGFSAEQAEGAVSSLDDPILLSMYEVAADEALSKVRAPVLAVYGSRDLTIAADTVIPAAQEALADNAQALVVVVPGVDHRFQRVDAEGQMLEEDTPNSKVIELVGWWLADALTP